MKSIQSNAEVIRVESVMEEFESGGYAEGGNIDEVFIKNTIPQ